MHKTSFWLHTYEQTFVKLNKICQVYSKSSQILVTYIWQIFFFLSHKTAIKIELSIQLSSIFPHVNRISQWFNNFWGLKRKKQKQRSYLLIIRNGSIIWFIFLKTTKKNCCLFIVTLRKLAFLLGNLCLHVEPKSTLFIACLAPAMYYISHSFQDYGIAWYYLFWETWNWLKLNNASYCKPPLTWIEFENHLLH